MYRKSQKLSLIEGFLYALMVGAGETYLPAYVLSIGMSEVFAGLLVSLPMVSGAFIQLVTPRLIQQFSSHKHWIVVMVLIQALTFIPLIHFTMTESPQFWTLFFVLTIYWASGFAAGPVWNYWMGRLIPIQSGQKFFAFRTRLVQYGTIIGLVIGGLSLNHRIEILPFASVFTGLFLVAFLARLLSSFLLSQHSFEKEWQPSRTLSFAKTIKVFINHPDKRKLFVVLIPFQCAVFVSAPFVNPYMLAQLKMDYTHYMLAIAALFFGKIVSLQIIEKMKSQISSFGIFKLGLFLIAPMPVCWAFSHDFYYIVILQLLSGVFWSLVEYGLSLIFFKDLTDEEKIPVITMYNFLNALAIIVGTYLGSRVLLKYGEVITSYEMLFVLGGCLRLFALTPMLFYMNKNE